MPTMHRRPLRLAARRRLLDRAVAILRDALAAEPGPAEHAATLGHFADHLGAHGLAATTTNLDELAHDLDVLEALEGGADVDPYMNVDRFLGTRDEAREWLVRRLERGTESTARRIAGAGGPRHA